MAKAPTDAIALLKADHKKALDLFEKYEKSRSKKAELAHQICTELMIHMAIEEEIFYPAIAESVEDDMMDEAYVEHDSGKMMIAELEAGSPDDDFYDAKVKVLGEEIKHHVKEEEQPGGIFAQTRKNSDLDLVELGRMMKARKDELKAEYEQSGLPTPQTRTMTGGKIERMEMAQQAV